MRNDTGEVFDGKPGLLKGFFRGGQHRDDSLFVHFLTGHMDGGQVHVCVFTRDRATRSTARHEQDVGILSVASDMGAYYTMRTATVAQNSRASAVAKQHARVAIGPVRD